MAVMVGISEFCR